MLHEEVLTQPWSAIFDLQRVLENSSYSDLPNKYLKYKLCALLGPLYINTHPLPSPRRVSVNLKQPISRLGYCLVSIS